MSTLPDRAWAQLNRARLEVDGVSVCLCASSDRERPALNYHQCFIRDFAICAPAFLLRGESDVVKRFLESVVTLQMRDHAVEAFQPRRGLMPASFRPVEHKGRWVLRGDYGEQSIARVTPVDSVFWWLVTLRAYTKSSGDTELAAREDFQTAIRLILELTLEGSFELFPTLLVPDGSFMIDRRLGVYGHPLEVQALFFAALRSALEFLDESDEWREPVERRLRNLAFHIERYYWLDRSSVQTLRRSDLDQYGQEVANVFNIFPESMPEWIDRWLPNDESGYFAGNVGPGRIDFRFFTQGNLMACFTGLATSEQRDAVMAFVETRWDQLVGEAPLRIVYPALEGDEWKVVTGADRKNEPWRYHNGGWWPCLLWVFANATLSSGRPDLLARAVEATEARIEQDGWPEYYDGRDDPRPGERARHWQSWSIGGYLYAKACLEDPSVIELYCWMGRMDEIRPEEARLTDDDRSATHQLKT